MKINYFPWTDVILFILSVTGLCAVLLIQEISLWFIIPGVLFTYFMTMRDASVIVLDSNRLKIISFNFLVGVHSIPRASVIKIKSIQTIQDETYEVYGSPYFTLKRQYELKYLNKEGKEMTVYFSISNRRKEKLIVEDLKLAGQGF